MTEVGTRKLRTRDSVLLRESHVGNKSANVAIVIRTFADSESQAAIRCHRRPRNSGRLGFSKNGPRFDIDAIYPTQIARTHPELVAVPCQCLWCHSRRTKFLALDN